MLRPSRLLVRFAVGFAVRFEVGFAVRFALAAAPVALTAGPAHAQPAPADAADAPRVLRAAPAADMHVDGVLDEEAWAAAEPATGFVQFEPDEGVPASEETEVRILVGGDALYVGARLYDREPHLIRRPLGRRDEIGQADRFIVALDAYNDRRTAYLFGITPAGVLFDSFMEGGDDDESWNAVWDGAVQLTADGWTAELRIPYSQLRFSEGTDAWGLNFIRNIRRRQEQSFWSSFTREEATAGLVQYFGRLAGVGGIRPRRVVQAAPYALARARRFEAEAVPGTADAAYASDVGADLKLGLASNVILDLTVNPDFGQVEADPAELNLTTFESVFNERRPFFLEGAQLFDLSIGSGDGALLYSRRIGAASRILGAAKVSGQTAGGFSFGALAAATGGGGLERDRLYGAARVRRQFGGQDYVGGGLTLFDYAPRPGDGGTPRRSAAGAADWEVRLGPDDGWMLEGSLAGSWQGVDGQADASGYALYVGFDRVRGYLTPGSGIRFYSPGFRLNDVGRFRQTDVIQARLGTGYQLNRNQPFGPFRRANAYGFGTQTWQYSGGANRGLEVNGGAFGQFHGFQTLNVELQLGGLGGVDVRETRGLGPIANLPGYSISVNYGTDQRRRLRLYPGFYVGTNSEGATDVTAFGEVDWTASDRLALSLNVFAEVRDGWRAWGANEGLVRTPDGLFLGAEAGAPDALDPAALRLLALSPAEADALLAGVLPFDGVVPVAGATGYYLPVFGTRDTRQLSLTARASWLFSPDLSFQLYAQAFAARGRYHDWRLLAGPDDLRPFDAYPKRRDFSQQAFNANAVLRWEYRPGSTLFVVWTQARGLGRDEELLLLPGAPPPASPFETTTGAQLRDTFALFPDNVFLVKLSYLVMR